MHKKKVKCVIFDCDGTLVDSEKLCCEALVNVFNSFGARYRYEDALANFEGGKLADILAQTRDHLNLQVSIDVLEPLYRDEVQKLFEHGLNAMDGAQDILQMLDSRHIEYCVATNGPQEKTKHALILTGLMPYFEGKVFSAFDTNSWKPEPDLIRYSAMNMGFTLEECLYIDDTPKGLEAGLRAGVRTLQLLGPHSRTYSHTVHAIDNLRDISQWL